MGTSKIPSNSSSHATDVSNASRTMLMDLESGA